MLYRGAGLDVVWPQLAAMAIIGAVLFAVAVWRFAARWLPDKADRFPRLALAEGVEY